MVRNCQLSDLIYLTAPARAGAAQGVSVRERVGELSGLGGHWALQPLPQALAPSEGRGVLPWPVGHLPGLCPLLEQNPTPTHLLPLPHSVTSFRV